MWSVNVEDAIALVHELENAVHAHDVETLLLNFYSENAATVSPLYVEVFGRTAKVGRRSSRCFQIGWSRYWTYF